MSKKSIETFCEKIREKLGVAECRSFSGRVEAMTALFDAIELGAKDCVYISALAPGYIVKAILACGAVPVFCDIVADSFTMDHRWLEYSVKQTINVDRLYPRAVIADDFCGMPFSFRAVRDVCDRMGMLLIEDCQSGPGGSWDGTPCGALGDYSVVSLGQSSVFGTGGSGCLVTAGIPGDLLVHTESCDGCGFQTADEMYAGGLLKSCDSISDTLETAAAAHADITRILKESDFWLQRGSGRQKSSCAGTVMIAQDEAHCQAAFASFQQAGLSRLARILHVHRRACFEHGCRGFKTIENASALAPRSIAVDIFGAINAGRLDDLTARMQYIADNIHA